MTTYDILTSINILPKSGMVPVQLHGAKWFLESPQAKQDELPTRLINPSLFKLRLMDWLQTYGGDCAAIIKRAFDGLTDPACGCLYPEKHRDRCRVVLFDAFSSGDIPVGMVPIPMCGDRRCVMPLHLMLLTEDDAQQFADEHDVNLTYEDITRMLRAKPTRRRTHCKRGHIYVEGKRHCYECPKARNLSRSRDVTIVEALVLIDSGELERKKRKPKTHCKRGHEFTPESTYVYKSGSRQCKICVKAKKSKSWQKLYENGVVDWAPNMSKPKRDRSRKISRSFLGAEVVRRILLAYERGADYEQLARQDAEKKVQSYLDRHMSTLQKVKSTEYEVIKLHGGMTKVNVAVRVTIRLTTVPEMIGKRDGVPEVLMDGVL